MTFVKTRLFIEGLAPGDIATIRLSGEEPLENIPPSISPNISIVIGIVIGWVFKFIIPETWITEEDEFPSKSPTSNPLFVYSINSDSE